jgi:isopentenyl phosphate kinase
MIFLKLGGSLITDKTGVEVVCHDVLARLAAEIAKARTAIPELLLLLGHGSGSFGHVAAAKYGTRAGVQTAEQWYGFAEVSSAASRLSKIVTDALLGAGVPAISFQPSASAACQDGQLTELAISPIRSAFSHGLVPVIHGDVAFDSRRGGTIVSTEEVMMALAGELRPSWLLLAGITDGVYDGQQQVIPVITRANFPEVETALGGSHGTDVTGGMGSKVKGMLDLVDAHPDLSIRIFSGLEAGLLERLLLAPDTRSGTVIRADRL